MRVVRTRSMMFLALRRLARSGIAVMTISSACCSRRVVQGAHVCGEIDGNERHVLAHDVDDRFAAFRRHVVIAVQDDWRCKDRQVLGARRQQPVEEHFIEAVRVLQRVGDALQRVLVEVKARGAEGEVEVGDDHVRLQHLRHCPRHVVADGRGPGAALGADEGEDVPDGIGLGIVVEVGDALHELDGRHRSDNIFAHAALQDLAVEYHVVHAADHDHFGAGVAALRQPVEFGEHLRPGVAGLDDY